MGQICKITSVRVYKRKYLVVLICSDSKFVPKKNALFPNFAFVPKKKWDKFCVPEFVPLFLIFLKRDKFCDNLSLEFVPLSKWDKFGVLSRVDTLICAQYLIVLIFNLGGHSYCTVGSDAMAP